MENLENLLNEKENNSTSFELESTNADKDLPSALVVTLYSMMLVISVFGVVANIVIILVFIKLGFQEHVNLTLCSLALSDLLTLLVLFCSSVAVLVDKFQTVEILDIKVINMSLFGWLHACFYNISNITTVFVSMERCLCVTFPFLFRHQITTRKNFTILAIIYTSVVACYMEGFVSLELGWVWNPVFNKTQLTFLYTPRFHAAFQRVYLYPFIISLGSETLVSVTTVALIRALHHTSSWRRAASAHKQNGVTLSVKERTVIQMVQVVAVVFVVTSSPMVILTFLSLVTNAASPQALRGAHRFWILTIWEVSKVFGAINASTNIFIFYRLSSKFKAGLKTFLYT